MKDDAPTPEVVPRKRRQLEAALDRWLREWLARDDLAPSDRRKVEDEIAQRKAATPTVTLGVLVDRAGLTPQQRAALTDYRAQLDPTQLVLSRECLEDVVRRSTTLFAAPRHEREPAAGEPGVWAAIRYARHRKVPVRIVYPSGKEA